MFDTIYVAQLREREKEKKVLKIKSSIPRADVVATGGFLSIRTSIRFDKRRNVVDRADKDILSASAEQTCVDACLTLRIKRFT